LNTDTSASDSVYPYRPWWGLLGCAALMAVILLLGPYSDGLVFAPDRGDMWYFWQLLEPTALTRLAVWVPYSLHQVAIWFLIYQSQHIRPRYVFGLHTFNLWALGINAFFVLAHIGQTKIFYDGLAQDVPEFTSMMSVILMLLLILLMENGRRGLFFGKKVRSIIPVGDTVKRYHGYYFSWAIIYTFWYHPVELTSGHMAGFAYMSLLLLQGSLFFTRFHVNRWWTMSLETLFVLHGALVAYTILQKDQVGPWSMFLFGGMATFLITQMHGLGISLRQKLMITAPCVAAMAYFYSIYPEHIWGVPKQSMIMYGGTFLMFGIVWVLIRLARAGKLLINGTAEADDPEVTSS
jgi:hypothetical protein